MSMNQSSDCSVLENLIPVTISEEDQRKLGGNQTITVVNIDLADIFRAHFESIKQAVEWGQNHPNLTPSTTQPSSGNGTPYLSIFDRFSYGVYNDNEKFLASRKYWDSSSVKQQEFSSYDEALLFARNGVAHLKGIPENTVTAMLYPLNWRQKI